MMDELLKELTPVVAHETQRASEQYGDRYASAHEAESVLREEVNELDKETSEVNTFMKFTTEDLHDLNNIHGDGENGKTGDNIENIKFHALNAAAEAIQVAAVCEKIARGFEK